MDQPSKSEGRKEQTVGTAKEKIGGTIGNERMEAEGTAQRKTGEHETWAAKTQEYISGTAEKMKGMAKENVGWAMGNEKMEAEGKLDREKGGARQEINK